MRINRLVDTRSDSDRFILFGALLVVAMFIAVMTKIISDAVNTHYALCNGYHQVVDERGKALWVK